MPNFSRPILSILLMFLPGLVLAWTPPLGIPAPTWPASPDIARPTLPSNWTADQAGFYFVSSANCSDSRTLGNPAAPRCSMPSSAAAGSVIVLSGQISGYRNVAYAGSASSPIWIMGNDPTNRPSVTTYWDVSGSYIILDSLAFSLSDQDGVNLVGNHIMLRNSTMVNPYTSANGSGFGIGGQYVVFYRNTVSQMGDWQYTGPDIDRQAIKVFGSQGASDIWILDSVFFHCQSDAVQVGDQNNTAAQINRVYVGRNSAYENLQFGFWTKNATDVIFSENLSYLHTRTTVSGPGGGFGGQYDPKYVWFINNTIHDANSGIHIAGSSNGGGGPWFAIGNVLYSINAAGNCNGYDYGALSYRNDGGFTAIFNTVYGADFFGGYPPSGGTVLLRNNIFAAKNSNSCAAFALERTVTHDFNLFSASAYDPGTEVNRVVGDPLFVVNGANFALQSTSPAIDKAAKADEAAFALFQSRYGIDIRRDMAGIARNAGTADIGAREFAPSVRPLSPASLTVQ